jgi:hypothetical protein
MMIKLITIPPGSALPAATKQRDRNKSGRCGQQPPSGSACYLADQWLVAGRLYIESTGATVSRVMPASHAGRRGLVDFYMASRTVNPFLIVQSPESLEDSARAAVDLRIVVRLRTLNGRPCA